MLETSNRSNLEKDVEHIKEKVDEMVDDFKVIKQAIYGNGKIGLVTEVQLLKLQMAGKNKNWNRVIDWVIGAAVSGLVVFLILGGG